MLRIRQQTKRMIISGLIGAGLIGILFAGYVMYSMKQQSESRATLIDQYEKEIQQIQKAYKKSTVSGWTINDHVTAGHEIKVADLKMVELPADSVPEDWIKTKNEAAGKIAKISISPNTLLTQTLLFENEATPDDLRYRDMGFIKLPASLTKNDVVDVRIQFPTGQDYILLAKKKIQSYEAGNVTMTIGAAEILSLSSAIVDAYLHKASIYAILYVEPNLQSEAVPTYPPNQAVLELIKRDPNIVNQAELALQASSRALLDTDLSVLSSEKADHFAFQMIRRGVDM